MARGQIRSGCIAALVVVMAAGASRAEDPADRKLPIDNDAENVLRSLAGPGAQLKRTAHFLVAYDTGPDALDDFVARLEVTFRSTMKFLDKLNLGDREPTARLQVLFFSTRNRFQEFAKQLHADATGAAGFYHPASNRAAFYDARSAPRITALSEQIETIEKTLRDRATPAAARPELARNLAALRGERDNTVEMIHQLVVQHEVSHEVFFNAGLHIAGADNPAWVVEGLACLFETPPSERGSGLGVQNDYRLNNFREALAGEGHAAEARATMYSAACRSGALVSLEQLIGDGSLFNTQRDHVENMYAEAWSLVYFLHRRFPSQFAAYLGALAKRKPGEDFPPADEIQQFEALVHPLDGDFTKRWLEFILQLPVRAQSR